MKDAPRKTTASAITGRGNTRRERGEENKKGERWKDNKGCPHCKSGHTRNNIIVWCTNSKGAEHLIRATESSVHRKGVLDIRDMPVRALPLNDGGREGVSVDRAGRVGRWHLLSGSHSDYWKPYRRVRCTNSTGNLPPKHIRYIRYRRWDDQKDRPTLLYHRNLVYMFHPNYC